MFPEFSLSPTVSTIINIILLLVLVYVINKAIHNEPPFTDL